MLDRFECDGRDGQWDLATAADAVLGLASVRREVPVERAQQRWKQQRSTRKRAMMQR